MTTTRVYVAGATGFLGTNVIKVLEARGVPYVGGSRQDGEAARNARRHGERRRGRRAEVAVREHEVPARGGVVR